MYSEQVDEPNIKRTVNSKKHKHKLKFQYKAPHLLEEQYYKSSLKLNIVKDPKVTIKNAIKSFFVLVGRD